MQWGVMKLSFEVCAGGTAGLRKVDRSFFGRHYVESQVRLIFGLPIGSS